MGTLTQHGVIFCVLFDISINRICTTLVLNFELNEWDNAMLNVHDYVVSPEKKLQLTYLKRKRKYI